jgi:hypothetical protein
MTKILCLIFFLLSTSLFAQSGGSKKNGFYFSVAGKGMMGTSGSEDTSYAESRDHYTYGAETILGYHFGRLLVGVSGEYNLWKQKTKPSEVSNSNMSGNQMNLAPVLGIGMGRFVLLGKMVVSSTMTLDKKNANGDETVYTSPSLASYVAQLNFKLFGRSYIGLEYNNVVYGKTKVGGTTSKLDDDHKITYGSWGLVYGYIF